MSGYLKIFFEFIEFYPFLEYLTKLNFRISVYSYPKFTSEMAQECCEWFFAVFLRLHASFRKTFVNKIVLQHMCQAYSL